MSHAIGYDELARRPTLSAGDLVPCTRCGGEHRVVESGPDAPGPNVPFSALVAHPSGRWLRRAEDDDWTEPCATCRERGSVPGDFPFCGPHNWTGGGVVCDACGEKMHELGAYAVDGRDGRWHLVDGRRFCGPVSPDPDWPNARHCYGRERRRATTILSFECGGEHFVVGLDGRSLVP